MHSNEIWTEMWDFPTYEISNLGNVRNSRTGRLLKVRQDGKEYRMVHLWYNKKAYLKRVARYVWMSFNQQYCSKTIHHINNNAGDDRIENLTCVSMKDNMSYRRDYSRKNKFNLSNEDKGYIHRSISDGSETTWTIMKKYGIPLNYIGTVMKRQSWRKYADSI